MNMLTGGGVEMEPDVEYFETMSTDAFNRADRDGSGQISFEVSPMFITSCKYHRLTLTLTYQCGY